jgi:hypothetical protein
MTEANEIELHLSPEQEEALACLARVRGVSPEELVVEALDRYLRAVAERP